MYKKIIKGFLALLFFISCSFITGHADQFGDFTYTLSGNDATIMGYTGSASVINIPNNLGDSNEYTVVAIGDSAFSGVNTFNRVTVPNSVNSIGSNAFLGCNESLVIECVDWNVPVMEYSLANNIACEADNVIISKIGILNSAKTNGYYYNGNVTHIEIPEGVTQIIGDSVFYNASFTNLTLPSTLQSIGYGAFYETDITSVIIPEGVTSIKSDAFGYCSNLQAVQLPSTVTAMDSHVFRVCPVLANIVVHNDNPNYSADNGMLLNKDKTVLYEYPSVTGVFNVPNNIETISDYCFYQNLKITGFVSNNVNRIQYSALNGCRNLESVNLEKQVTFASNVFYYTNKLSDLIVANNLTSFNASVLYGTNSIENVWCNVDSNAAIFFGEKAKRPISITNVPLNNRVVIGDTVTLQVTDDSNFTSLNTYVPSSITWSSSNNAIATVSNTGEVTGVSSGSVTISASRDDGLKATVDLNIIKPVLITSVYNDTGYSSSDYITKIEQLYITGDTHKNCSINLIVDNNNVLTQTSSNDGSFEFNYEFDEGSHSVYVEAIKDSNTYQSDVITLVIDKTKPQALSFSPSDEAESISLKPTITVEINELVKYYNINNDSVTTALLNTIEANDNVICVRYNSLADCIEANYTAIIEDKSFTYTPKSILFPNTTYELLIQKMIDYAGNGFNQQITNFTTENSVAKLNPDKIELIDPNIPGMVYSINSTNGCTVTLDFCKVDSAKVNVANSLNSLKTQTQSFEQNRIIGDNYENFAGVQLRVWTDTEYDKFCLAYDGQYKQWTHQGDLLLDNDSNKKYIDIYPYIANYNDQWYKNGGSSTVSIAFFNDTTYTVKEFDFVVLDDYDAPSGYSIEFSSQNINYSNEDSFSFNVNDAEIGSMCTYTISDTDDETVDISNSEEVSESTKLFTDIDLSSLKDGAIKIDVTLRDQAGNTGNVETRYITKKSSRMTTTISTSEAQTYLKEIPVTITFDDNDDNFSNQMSGFLTDDIVVINGTASLSNHNGPGVYSCLIYPNDYSIETDIIISIADNACTDDFNNPNLAAESLTIHYIPNEPPQIEIGVDDNYQAKVGEEIVIDLSNHFSDPDNDLLTYSFTSYTDPYPTDPQLGELTGSVWRFTPQNEHLNKTYRIDIRATDDKSQPITLSFNLRAPDTIDYTVIKKDCSSYNANDGSITIQINDITRYEYSIDGGDTYSANNVFSNLAASSYHIVVKDTQVENNYSHYNVTLTKPSKPVYTPPSKPKKHEVTKALEKAKKDEHGVVQAVIEQSKRNYQGVYSQNIPSTYFKGDTKKLNVITPIALVNIPSNMFSQKIIGRLDFTVEEVDKKTLSPEKQKLVGDKPLIDVNMLVNRKKSEWFNKNTQIEIIIPYVPTERELQNDNINDCIIAYYLSPIGEIIPITMSEYDHSRGGVVFNTNHLSMYGVMVVDKVFTDIENIEWAHKAIASLTTRGIVKGRPGAIFAPKDFTSRADMVIFINRFFGIKGSVDSNFSDVEKGKYYYNEISVAKQAGILKHIADDKFYPEEPITREDMMVLIKNALDYMKLSKKLSAANELGLGDFTDAYLVSEYATEGVEFLISKAIVGGYNSKISPNECTTRVDVVAILYKLLLALQR